MNREDIPLTPGELVLITGATGSVGALAVEQALARGYRVRATDRLGSARPPQQPGLSWIEEDLARPRPLTDLCEGAAAVIHCAAWVDIHVPFEAQAPINLDAVRRLYQAAEQVGARSFVFLSTGSLYAPSDVPLDEEAPLEPASGYEQAKLLAEDYLRSRVGAGPRVTMLRPALIYGPRGKVLLSPLATIPVLLGFLDGHLPGISGGPRTNVVHALDVARAALFLLDHPQPDGSVFNVAADEVAALGAYLEWMLTEAGLHPASVSLPFPTGLLRAVQPLISYPELSDVVNTVLGRLWQRQVSRHELVREGVRPRVDVEALPYATHDTVFDNSRLKHLGFLYRFPDFASGWADTARWYRQHRWLPERTGAAQVA